MNEVFQHRVTRFVVVTLAGIAAGIAALAVTDTLASGEQSKPSSVEQTSQVDCARCHTCDKPTHQIRCLVPCARATLEAIAETFAGKQGPDLVIMDELENRYLPVPFDHKGHAEMANMTGGCGECHHYTPEGAAHPACKTCHEISPARRDIRLPGLRGAYHRQCMNCHREWSDNTKCSVCHLPKAGGSAAPAATELPTPDDIMGVMHPPIPEPETLIYETRSESESWTQAVFRHKAHTERYGIKCANCHREESCSRCHAERAGQPARAAKTVDQRHAPCAPCHADELKNNCTACHWGPGQSMPALFDHAQTGWALSQYHQDKSCRVCHASIPFAELDRTCNSCHSDWEPDSFNHAVTGQTLDEDHEENDCADCHNDRKFDAPPTCSECHDEEEIAFPAKRPGPLTKAAGK